MHFIPPSSPRPGISFPIWLKRTFLLSTFTSSFPCLLYIIHCSLAVSPQIPEVTNGLLLDSFFLTYFPLIILWIMDTVPYNSEILSSCTLIQSLILFNFPKVVSLGFFFSWYPPIVILHWSMILVIMLNLYYKLEFQTSTSNIPSWSLRHINLNMFTSLSTISFLLPLNCSLYLLYKWYTVSHLS